MLPFDAESGEVPNDSVFHFTEKTVRHGKQNNNHHHDWVGSKPYMALGWIRENIIVTYVVVLLSFSLAGWMNQLSCICSDNKPPWLYICYRTYLYYNIYIGVDEC